METSVGRIRRRTVETLNVRLQTAAKARLAYYARHPDAIDQRLRELDQEWDIERAIELEAAGTVLTGFVLGMTVNKKWFLLAMAASAMLLLHNVRGEYPLLPVFRRLGLRTANEINEERYALKAIRGDFDQLQKEQGHQRIRTVLKAASPTGKELTRAFDSAI